LKFAGANSGENRHLLMQLVIVLYIVWRVCTCMMC